LVKLGYTAACRTGTRRRAAPNYPRAPPAVPPPWRPGRAPAEIVRLPKASRASRLPSKSGPPHGAPVFVVGHAPRYPLVRPRPPLSSAPVEVLDPVRTSGGRRALKRVGALPRRNGPRRAPASFLDSARRAPLSKPTATKQHSSLALTP
jgi:hypothetical protein